MAVGDSKSVGITWLGTMVLSINASWPGTVLANWDVTTPTGNGYLARGGATVASQRALIDSDIASMSEVTQGPMRILVNFGANDVGALPAEAVWEGDLGYILDALHTKYPLSFIYVTIPWRRDKTTECNTLAGWIATTVSTRATWAFVGDDERVWLENGDDGVTNTTDGVHYNTAGLAKAAQVRKLMLGY